MPIEAVLNTTREPKRRGKARRELKLHTRGQSADGSLANVSVVNLSTTGLLLQTEARLSVNDELMVDLPGAGMSRARVIWASDDLFGCAFDHALREHIVSAALLRSEPKRDLSPAHEPRKTSPASLSGAALRQLRVQKGLSLIEFAEQMHVSRPTVWAWESGKSKPRASKLRRLAEVLGPLQEELSGTDSSSPADSDARTPLDERPSLASAIAEAKDRIAEVAGTTPDHIKVTIEL